jgi:hypothetical protein
VDIGLTVGLASMAMASLHLLDFTYGAFMRNLRSTALLRIPENVVFPFCDEMQMKLNFPTLFSKYKMFRFPI